MEGSLDRCGQKKVVVKKIGSSQEKVVVKKSMITQKTFLVLSVIENLRFVMENIFKTKSVSKEEG